MGAKEKILADICTNKYGKGNYTRPNKEEYRNSKYYGCIQSCYKELNGILDTPPTNIGKYDIILNNFIIELDEENHFNRYRLITLESQFYDQYKNFNIEEYKLLCEKYENKCRTYGKFWSNKSTEEQFGESQTKGTLTNNGSSRWKQRAFYDFIKDISSAIIGIPLIRISIYDIYKSNQILDLIKNERTEILLEYIDYRIKTIEH